MWRHPSPLRATQEPSKNIRINLNQRDMHLGSPLLSILRAISRRFHRHPPDAKSHLCTISIQPNLDLPRTHPPLTSAMDTHLPIRYWSIIYTCPNHLNNLWSTLLVTLKIPHLKLKGYNNLFFFVVQKCSMIDHFLGDAFGISSCPFWSTALQYGALLPIHTLNY